MTIMIVSTIVVLSVSCCVICCCCLMCINPIPLTLNTLIVWPQICILLV